MIQTPPAQLQMTESPALLEIWRKYPGVCAGREFGFGEGGVGPVQTVAAGSATAIANRPTVARRRLTSDYRALFER